MDKVSWRMRGEIYCRMYVHDNRVLTACGCDGQGVMEDVRRYIMYMYSRMYMYMKIEYLRTDCGCAGSDGQGVVEDVGRDIQCTCTVECT